MTKTLNRSIFRAYDIRGIYPETLSLADAELIGRAIGSEATDRGLSLICTGYDGRLSSPELNQALTRGILATGINVIELGLLPTPALYYGAIERGNGSGVMITGSHNPKDYNGFKIMLDGHTLSGQEIDQLYQRISNNNLYQGSGERYCETIQSAYLKRLQQGQQLTRPLKVIVDCGNGVPGPWIEALLEQLGCDTTALFCDVDGNFPNHHPDPEKPESLQDLIAAIKSQQADIGLALDGDGDRLALVTETGQIITPDQLLCLFSEQILKDHPGSEIIYDVKSSLQLRHLIERAGGIATMWKCGHSMIKNHMKQKNALFGGEFSGHIFFADHWYGFDDALYAAVRFLALLSSSEVTATELFSPFPPLPSTPMINIPIADEDKFELINQLSQQSFADADIFTIDGLRVEFNDGWFGIRASNTTPMLTLRIEAGNQQALLRISNILLEKLKLVNPGLQIPELAVTNDTNTANRDI